VPQTTVQGGGSGGQATTLPQPFVVDLKDVPQTAQEVQALRIRMNDLRSELQEAAERRNSVASRLRSADVAARPGYEARLQVLDARIIQIERDMQANTARLNAAPAAAIVGARALSPDAGRIAERISGDLVPIIAIFTVFVLAPFAFTVSRFIWKRGNALGARAPGVDQATLQRLEELQQSVDTIAIEVERISENQRFVTRMLSEQPALGAGAAEPLHSGRKASVPERR
jgi:hypothetical protein